MTLRDKRQPKIIRIPRKGTLGYDYYLDYHGKRIEMNDGLTALGLGLKLFEINIR